MSCPGQLKKIKTALYVLPTNHWVIEHLTITLDHRLLQKNKWLNIVVERDCSYKIHSFYRSVYVGQQLLACCFVSMSSGKEDRRQLEGRVHVSNLSLACRIVSPVGGAPSHVSGDCYIGYSLSENWLPVLSNGSQLL